MTAGELAGALQAVWAGISPIEAAGAAFGVLYVLLSIPQHRACWPVAMVSTSLYLCVFFAAHLYLQAALQAYYILVSVYGWYVWRGRADAGALPVTRAAWPGQWVALAAILIVSLVSAAWLARETGSRDPLLDSLTTWASVYATWLMARKKLENWVWWFVIDAAIMLLCWRQGLYPSMILYGLYVALAVTGWRAWARDLQRHTAKTEAVE